MTKTVEDIKLSYQLATGYTDDDLQFIRQLGIEWVSFNAIDDDRESFESTRRRLGQVGLRLANISVKRHRNMPEVVLGLPGRDRLIDEYKRDLSAMAAVGVSYVTYAHMANGIWMSWFATRGGARTRGFDPSDAVGVWMNDRFQGPITHGRKYRADEIRDNLDYFLARVLPAAEECGIRIGVHPDDPPGLPLGGVPRTVFSTLSGYREVFNRFRSPALGACLCVGSWLEGGTSMGGAVEEAVREFAADDRLFKVHLRNVSSPTPRFLETFIDDGYGDIPHLMSVLREVSFSGILIADHVPDTVYGPFPSWGYHVGYIKGLLDATRQNRP